MARAIWSGAISFGLVNIPVRMFTAVSRKNVRFNMIDSRSDSRIRQLRVSSVDGEEVPADKLVKGYEITKGQYVTVSDEELAALDPEASRTIDITEFVDLAEIDPVYYDSAYFLAPDELARKAYALLVAAMEESQKVAIASFVMRTKQYLAALRPSDGALMLSTMVYADEVNSADDVEGLDEVGDVEVSEQELAMANQLIESLSAEFEPGKYHDTYRERVLDLIERKAAGETEIVALAEPPPADKVVDLMAALEASVADAKQARTRHPSAAPEEAEATKPAKRPKRKTA